MSELGGIGGVNIMMNEAIKSASDARKVAQEIVIKLKEFIDKQEEGAKQDALKKAQEAVERLQKIAKNMGITINNLTNINNKIGDLRSSGISPSDSEQLKKIQDQIAMFLKQMQI